MHAGLWRLTCLARQHLHPLGDDEGRVEADAELSDELRGLLLITGQRAEELGRSRPGDRAEVRNRFLAPHPDTVVADRHGARCRVRIHSDLELRVLGKQLGRGDRSGAQPVVGVGGVGNELPEKDLPVAVQGVDHQLQQLAHFRLEAMRLLFGGLFRARHARHPLELRPRAQM